jgi:hypothetical protein
MLKKHELDLPPGAQMPWRKDQRIPADLLQRDASGFRQRMIGRRDQDGIEGDDRLELEAADFVEALPNASPDVVMQHWAGMRKARGGVGQINASRPPAELLAEMIVPPPGEDGIIPAVIAAVHTRLADGNAFMPRR